MNEELQKALIEVINGFTSAAQGAAGFATEKAPEVIKQLIFYERLTVGTYFSLSLFFSVIFSYISFRFYKKSKLEPFSDEYFLSYCIFLTISFCFFMITIAILAPFLKVFVAPDIFLIEYAARLF